MPRKAVVFGSAGQLGRRTGQGIRGSRVSGYAPPPAASRYHRRQCRRAEPCRGDPAVVVNAAAYNQVDIAEREPKAAYLVNALAVRNLAVACRQIGAVLVHFSTDYVFDGRARRPYTEEDATHPLGAYAVSKLAGELYARAYLDNALVIRTSGVFGLAGRHTAHGNFIELMLRLASEGRPIRVVEDHVASPTFAPLLAARTLDLVERAEYGVFHIGGGTPISWYDYSRMIFVWPASSQGLRRRMSGNIGPRRGVPSIRRCRTRRSNRSVWTAFPRLRRPYANTWIPARERRSHEGRSTDGNHRSRRIVRLRALDGSDRAGRER